MKLTAKQIQVIKLMRNGHPLVVGQSETTNQIYYMIAVGWTHENVYLRSDTFSRLLENRLIGQHGKNFDYILTDLGETCELKLK